MRFLEWLSGLCSAKDNRRPPLTEREVLDFESAYGIRLPEDYRNYLLTVAGTTPGFAPGYGLHNCLGHRPKPGDFLQSPFPHMQDWNEMDNDSYEDDVQVAGSLLLAHLGCTHYVRLVVTGPMRGTVWGDSRGGSEGLVMLENAAGNPMTFEEWIHQNGG